MFSEVKMRKQNVIIRLVLLALLLYSLGNLAAARLELVRQREDTLALLEQEQALLAERAALEARLHSAGDPAFMRRLAWERLGMVAPGETVYFFNGGTD